MRKPSGSGVGSELSDAGIIKHQRSARTSATRISNSELLASELLARDYLRLREQIRQASKDLHDHAGSQLAAAGLRLQMLSMETLEGADADQETARAALAEITDVLAGAMGSVREVSKNLSTSPVRALGLKAALEELADRHGVSFKYGATLPIPYEVGDWIYHIADLALAELPREGRVSIRTSGARKLILTIRARCRLRTLHCMSKAQILAKNCGFSFRIDSAQVTIVRIEYAIRRVSR